MTNEQHVLYRIRECIPVSENTIVPRNITILNTAKVHHGMLMNLMRFNDSNAFWREGLRMINKRYILYGIRECIPGSGNIILPRNIKVFKHREGSSRNTYKPNAFTDFNAFWRKGLQNDKQPIGFTRDSRLQFAGSEIIVLPSNIKVFEHRESASRTAYKPNAFQ